MDRKLIIDGNAVYELDENCMLKKHSETEENSVKKQNGKHHSSYADIMHQEVMESRH